MPLSRDEQEILSTFPQDQQDQIVRYRLDQQRYLLGDVGLRNTLYQHRPMQVIMINCIYSTYLLISLSLL